MPSMRIGIQRRTLWLSVFCSLGLLLAGLPAAAQSAPVPAQSAQPSVSEKAQTEQEQKVQAIRTMLQLTRADKLIDRVLEQVISAFLTPVLNQEQPLSAQSRARIENVFFEELKGELEKIRPAIEAAQIATFAKGFTLDEINELVAFYRTTAGQKLIAQGEDPETFKDIGAIVTQSQTNGQAAARRALARLQTEGLLK